MALNWNQPPKRKYDIVSSLPDEILINILSLISTKYAARTSVLSSRWEFLWTFVPNLNFTFSRDHDDKDSFMNLVDRVLLFHNLPNIERFSLDCVGKLSTFLHVNELDKSRLNGWIGAAIKRNVKQVSIKSVLSACQLPKYLFTCKSLVTLKLSRNFQLDVPCQINFPCLRDLRVSICSWKNGFPMRLFNSCPVLEILYLEVAGVFKERTFKISIPTLRRLNLQMCTDPYRELESVFIIDAPVLDTLSLINNCGTRYVLENPSLIVEGRLWWFTPKRQDLLGNHTYALRNLEKNFGLLNTFSQVKRLDLNNTAMADLGIADVKDWPLFSNLLELQVIVSDDPGFKSLSVLLIKAPMLERLTFANVTKQLGHGNQRTWYKPEESPRYLQTCLRTIKLMVKGPELISV